MPEPTSPPNDAGAGSGAPKGSDPVPLNYSAALGEAFDALTADDGGGAGANGSGQQDSPRASDHPPAGADPAGGGERDGGADPNTEGDGPTVEGEGGDDVTLAPEHWSAEDRELLESLPEDRRAAVLAWRKSIETNADARLEAASSATRLSDRLLALYRPHAQTGVELTPDHIIAATEHLLGWQQALNGADPVDGLGRLVDMMVASGRFAGNGQAQQALARLQTALGITDGARDDGGQASDDDYLDPTAAREIRGLRQTIDGLTRKLDGLERQRDQDARSTEDRQVAEVRARLAQVRDEKGADGKPLRPFWDDLVDDMRAIHATTGENDPAKLYDRALWANPKTREQEIKRANEARDLERSKARSDAAKKAAAASTPRSEVGAKAGGNAVDPGKFRSRRAELEAVFDAQMSESA